MLADVGILSQSTRNFLSRSEDSLAPGRLATHEFQFSNQISTTESSNSNGSNVIPHSTAVSKPISIVTPNKKMLAITKNGGQSRTMSSAQLGASANIRRVNSPIVVKSLIDDFSTKPGDFTASGKYVIMPVF